VTPLVRRVMRLSRAPRHPPSLARQIGLKHPGLIGGDAPFRRYEFRDCSTRPEIFSLVDAGPFAHMAARILYAPTRFERVTFAFGGQTSTPPIPEQRI
jgi:hypothetical protein